ncbi:hypothetical protein BX666DRAFT_1989903 [Dichotomocladium elegans]|nr:hypothetical protein BX666DRAFT_1989903 [Dichotomocladium elegans]
MHSNDSEQKPRARLTKATTSMATLQPLEITMTAVVTPEEVTISPSINTKAHQDPRQEMRRKQSQHRHHIKSPIFTPDNSVSPLLTPSPNHAEAIFFPTLPPPAWTANPGSSNSSSSNNSSYKGSPSEAIVALQDAVNEGVPKKAGSATCLDQLLESSFFSAVLLLQWSNVMGPKIEKVWSSDEAISKDEKLQALIGRQVLNGEMGRSFSTVELKWIALHRQAILCASFLYTDDTIDSLCAMVFVLPVRYLRNFSPYFEMVKIRVPRMLVGPLQQLRRIHKRRNLGWESVLEFFANRRLAPFIHSIMKAESVSLPCGKVNYSLLDQESRQLFDTPFFAKLVTSHLQTFGSTVLTGNSLTTINAVCAKQGSNTCLFIQTTYR